MTQHCKPPSSCSHRASKPQWWCDVAAEGCLRPTQPTHEGEYSDADACYVHPNGYYMVCTACYRTGRALDQELLLEPLLKFLNHLTSPILQPKLSDCLPTSFGLPAPDPKA